MKNMFVIIAFVLTVSMAGAVPGTINFQGHVESGGVPVNSNGLFRFAIVNVDGTETYWSNDGTSTTGSEPVDGLLIEVQNGLFHVLLGDTSIPNMTAIDDTVFNNDDLKLRIWFDDETGTGSQLLTPDQPLSSTCYAFRAIAASDADTLDGIDSSDLEESDEIDSDIATHSALTDVHHTKTTSFTELTDSATDAQIPNDITINYATSAGNADTLDGLDSTSFGDNHSLDASDGNPVDALIVDTDGNVGIGTNSPVSKLDINGIATASEYAVYGSPEGVITLKRQDNTNGGNKIKFQNSGGWYQWNIHQTPGSQSDLCIAGGHEELVEDLADHLTIKNNGNIGIGTAEPIAKLDVAGTVNATAYTGDGSGITGINIDLNRVLTNGNDAMSNDMVNLGNVGIGTISSDSNLHVVGSFDVDIEGEVEDQDNSGSPQNAVGVTDFWQSFTPSVSGNLSKVEIYVFNYESTSNFTLSIYDGQGTGGTLLGSEVCSLNGQTEWNTFELSAPISLSAETEYTMSFTGFPYTALRVTMDEAYPRGTSSLNDPNDDFLFRTHMVCLQSVLCVESKKVGMGTTDPSYNLDVHGSTTTFIANFRNTRDAPNSNGIKVRAGDSGSDTGADYVNFRNPDDDPMGKIEQSSSNSVIYATTSDERLKTSIHTTGLSISDLMSIEVVDYSYQDDPKKIKTGFLAQQLYNHFPEAVSPGGDNPQEDPWMIDYGRVTPLLVKAIQEQQRQIEMLKDELDLKVVEVQNQEFTITEQTKAIAEQKKSNDNLTRVIQDLKNRIDRLEELTESL